MLTRRAVVLLAAACTATLLARPAAAQTPVPPAGGEAFWDRGASAEALVQAMFAVQSTTGSDADTVGTTAEQDAAAIALVAPYLDPAYQMQRASGERYVTSTYVPADIDAFEIVDVRESRPTEALVVARYAARTPGSTTPDTSMVMSDELAPRLTVSHWDDDAGHWTVLSHANFFSPMAAICDEAPLAPPTSPDVPTSAADRELGQALIDRIGELSKRGAAPEMLDPQVQVQTAGGAGFTTLAERKLTKYVEFEFADMLVTRNDDVLVANYRASQVGQVAGTEVDTEWEPRMMTFRLDERGEWKVVASAIFAAPAALPAGATCTPEG